MKIQNLSGGSTIYTSNVYLITGTWNAFNDVNTLIDVGRDPAIIEIINNASTGVGKKRIDQVILTHSHYDHANLLPRIRDIFNPQVFAFSPSLEGVDHLLKDGEVLKMGDRIFEIIYAPGHSNDSICIYCEEEQILFVGDTNIHIQCTDGSYEKRFVMALEKLRRMNVKRIYSGHGNPILNNCNEIIRTSLENVRKGKINRTYLE
ncbi:putative polyketide biosynthesis zinc-dependent hydrolase PksB [Methanosarcinales archaeon]|nr:MBL fold metallo-hydrolase [Candidatus Methanoperedens sp. BLZ2]KAB2943804.1 MAG: MBL fold metallo-hydrolase [Candidatus Methanoperedens sp.]MBZ0177389.1 MBL fold metallo-hydrolase [Candidatus Methanoperedens nitroreducens]CAG1000839.1 putative polyketide biosynthesis zinc-dependent hydrolase PksB [Methanosarcinales archaeon]MCX9077819.1 MBL fold metallo-hydrolase [Candidatus Methanoperedens sp.]MCX9087915.1 MBL fold metallo-hydrolase [Candidatus Methanoperedens sp.]